MTINSAWSISSEWICLISLPVTPHQLLHHNMIIKQLNQTSAEIQRLVADRRYTCLLNT